MTNLDNVSFGEIKELISMIGCLNGQQSKISQTKENSMLKNYIGKYVIVRSRNEGINAGEVLDIDETGVILKDARRLYYHAPKNSKVSWYEGVAQSGLSDSSKVGAVCEKVIVENYSLTICTSDAEQSIRGAKDHEQN